MTVRIISGSAKGRQLQVLKGNRVRPTSDRVKEAIFNILGDIQGTTVLDLFAGSGNLGIEALSRGASSATFVEPDTEARTVLKSNLTTCGFDGVAEVHTAIMPVVFDELVRQDKLYDLVFLDPPYHTNLLNESLMGLHRHQLVKPGAYIVAEHDWRDGAPDSPTPEIERRDTRRYGDTSITLYRANEFTYRRI